MDLQFIESSVYSSQIDDLLSAEEHHQLQLHLLEQPERGDIIKGAGGLRKLRWAGSGRGKRGGIRVIYYLFTFGEETPLFYFSLTRRINKRI